MNTNDLTRIALQSFVEKNDRLKKKIEYYFEELKTFVLRDSVHIYTFTDNERMICDLGL